MDTSNLNHRPHRRHRVNHHRLHLYPLPHPNDDIIGSVFWNPPCQRRRTEPLCKLLYHPPPHVVYPLPGSPYGAPTRRLRFPPAPPAPTNNIFHMPPTLLLVGPRRRALTKRRLKVPHSAIGIRAQNPHPNPILFEIRDLPHRRNPGLSCTEFGS